MATAPLAAQEPMRQIKALYASAEYEDVLALLGRLQTKGQKGPELEQYRAFCLVALGRTGEAAKVIASLVSSDPTFVPDADAMSPRIQEMFDRSRREQLPQIAQRMYLDARGALDRKDRSAATTQFEALLRLIDTAGSDQGPLVSELRVLASGFLDLSRALPEPEPARPVPALPQQEAVATITPAIAIKQDLPQWVPSDQSTRHEFRGAIRVEISETGRVTSATITQVVHPAYDRLLAQAARNWQYQPALRNGTPVASEKVIEVVLKPR